MLGGAAGFVWAPALPSFFHKRGEGGGGRLCAMLGPSDYLSIHLSRLGFSWLTIRSYKQVAT